MNGYYVSSLQENQATGMKSYLTSLAQHLVALISFLLCSVFCGNLALASGSVPNSSAAIDSGDYGAGKVNLISPVGKFGGKNPNWKPEWSKAFFTCLHREEPSLLGTNPSPNGLVGAMINGGFSDFGAGKNMCSTGTLGAAEGKLAALRMFAELCVPEAFGCRQEATNKSSTAVTKFHQGQEGIAYGLFQIGIVDAKAHKCKDMNGKPIRTKEQLKNGADNVCCALKIAQDIHKKNPKASLRDTMHKFWQPFGKHYPQIKSGVDSACTAIANNRTRNVFTQDEINLARGNSFQPGPTHSDDSGNGDALASN